MKSSFSKSQISLKKDFDILGEEIGVFFILQGYGNLQ